MNVASHHNLQLVGYTLSTKPKFCRVRFSAPKKNYFGNNWCEVNAPFVPVSWCAKAHPTNP